MKRLEGAIDSLTRWGATGWAWIPDMPDQAVQIEAVADGKVVGRALADQMRPDLAGQNKGTGRCGFVLTFAEVIADDVTPMLQALGTNGPVPLHGTELSSVAGYVDTIFPSSAVGWAWMPSEPDQAVEVEAVLDGRIIGRAFANQMRADLVASGRGSGCYGFTLQFIEPLVEGAAVPAFRVPHSGAAVALKGPSAVTPTVGPSGTEGKQKPITSGLDVEGAIDSLTRWGATGWAWMPGAPDQAIEIEATLNGKVIGRTLADQMRSDLAEQDKGAGRCGFVLTFAEDVASDVTPLLHAQGPKGPVPLAGNELSSISGYVDTIASWGAVGWAWMPEAPEQAVQVEAVLNNKVIGTALANQMRADLAASGRGTGRYGFTLQFNMPLGDSVVPEFRVPQPEGAIRLRNTSIITTTTQPSNSRQVREPTVSSLNVEGAVDSLTRWGATGWAWMPNAPDQIVEIEAVLDGRVIGHAFAEQTRPDLVDQGRGLGRRGFILAFSEPSLIDAQSSPLIRVKGPEGSTVLVSPNATEVFKETVNDRTYSDQSEIKGAVDHISPTEALGWAWMPGAPDQSVEIEAFLEGKIVGRTFADQMRSDLLEHKLGTGLYGFLLPFKTAVSRENLPQLIANGAGVRVRLPPPSTIIFPDEVPDRQPEIRSDSMRIEGHIDLLTRWYAAGWAWLPHDPKQSVQIEAVLEDKIIGRAVADQMRSDLAAHGKGTGLYGFKLQFETPVVGNKTPSFRALAAVGDPLPGALRLPAITAAEKTVSLRGTVHTLLVEHTRFTSRGPKFEDIDNTIIQTINADSHFPLPLIVAFYLPQFHPIPENDRFWGEGFTEWRQLGRGFPRFPGHYQPRIPRDLGFYNLLDQEVLRKQSELAKTHGVGAFAYYYYWFNRSRVLEKPLELHLGSDVAMPFFLIWANENWTRTWDGSETDILLKQDYKLEDDDALVEDLMRHFYDPRYVRLSGRPLFVIYNPKNIPNSAATVQRWRDTIERRMGVEPLIFMAQTFGEYDPRLHGLDGALEFPPHKLSNHLPGRPTPDAYSSEFAGRVISYDDFVKASLNDDESEDYPLIKTAVPSWDNDCRRPNRGLTLEAIDPAKYQRWLTELITRAIEAPILGTPIVAINAWNEWAESAYLEPDVYYGAAFLNATARAYVAAMNAGTARTTSQSTVSAAAPRVSVIFPNYNHARFLPERIDSVINQTVPPNEIIFLDDCSVDGSVEVARKLLQKSSIPYRIVVNDNNSGGVFRQWMKGLSLAKHELIWVAETDDSADHRFLSELLPAFEREEVMAAFGRISCIDQKGGPCNDLDDYFDGLRDFSWAFSSMTPAFRAFSNDFAIKNVIPNASGLVFRKPTLNASEIERLFEYRFAGDWYFYALVARGGAIAYRRRARSYFRVSPTSASRSSFFTDRHLLEHQMTVRDLRREYAIPDTAIASHVEALLQHLTDKSSEDLVAAFTQQAQTTLEQQRLRICIAANGFSVGGGEILPIELANQLKEIGLHVTYLAVEKGSDRETNKVRGRLRNDIPVLYWDDVCEDFVGFIRDYGIQAINSHNVSFDYRLYLRQIDPGVPYVISLHGGFETVPDLLSPEFVSYLNTNVSRWLFLAEKNIAFLPAGIRSGPKVSQSFNAVPTYGGDWIDRDDFRREHGIAQDAFVFVQCSRAIEAKGWRTSIEIVERLSARVDRTLHLVLIGDGPAAEPLRAEHAGSRLVTFLGQVDQPIRYFRCFDMGLFPSTFEGETFPLFLLECFAAGLPAISTDIGEIARIMEAIEGFTPGLTIDHSAPLAEMTGLFVDRLAEMFMVSDTYDHFREAATVTATRFSMSELASLYASIFQTVLACSNVPAQDTAEKFAAGLAG